MEKIITELKSKLFKLTFKEILFISILVLILEMLG